MARYRHFNTGAPYIHRMTLPWERLIDELYEMGGYGEWPTEETSRKLDSDVDLTQRTDLSKETIEEAATALERSGLADTGRTVESPEDEPPNQRMKIRLNRPGFQLSNSRREAERNREMNQSVAFLTLALAFVGIAEAVSILAQVSDPIKGVLSGLIVLLAVLFVWYIFRRFYDLGILDIPDLE